MENLEAVWVPGEVDPDQSKSSQSNRQKAKDKRRATSGDLLKIELSKLQKQKSFSSLHLNKVSLSAQLDTMISDQIKSSDYVECLLLP